MPLYTDPASFIAGAVVGCLLMPLFLTIASLDVVLFNWRKELAATALHLLMIMYRNVDNIVMERTLRLQYTVAAQSRMPLCGESVMKKQSRFIRTLYRILSFPVWNLLRCWFGKWRLGEKMQEIRSKIGKRCHVGPYVYRSGIGRSVCDAHWTAQ